MLRDVFSDSCDCLVISEEYMFCVTPFKVDIKEEWLCLPSEHLELRLVFNDGVRSWHIIKVVEMASHLSEASDLFLFRHISCHEKLLFMRMMASLSFKRLIRFFVKRKNEL
jgi:hypothetical protein